MQTLAEFLLQDSLSDKSEVERYVENASSADRTVNDCEEQLAAVKASVSCNC